VQVEEAPVTRSDAMNRRAMLLGLAASTTAAAAAGATPLLPAEHPDLLALADRLPTAERALLDAQAAVTAIAERWRAAWPVPDPRIRMLGEGLEEPQLLQPSASPVSVGQARRMNGIGTPEMFRASAERHRKQAERAAQTRWKRNLQFHLDRAARDEAAIEPARAYWSEVERITRASGIGAARDTLAHSRRALRDLVGCIVTFEERTALGLVLKAQAVAAWASVEPVSRAENPDATLWSEQLAASIIRQSRSNSG
jgi:hypothetical protein